MVIDRFTCGTNCRASAISLLRIAPCSRWRPKAIVLIELPITCQSDGHHIDYALRFVEPNVEPVLACQTDGIDAGQQQRLIERQAAHPFGSAPLFDHRNP